MSWASKGGNLRVTWWKNGEMRKLNWKHWRWCATESSEWFVYFLFSMNLLHQINNDNILKNISYFMQEKKKSSWKILIEKFIPVSHRLMSLHIKGSVKYYLAEIELNLEIQFKSLSLCIKASETGRVHNKSKNVKVQWERVWASQHWPFLHHTVLQYDLDPWSVTYLMLSIS
jgi:hypothetical protein